MRFRAHPWFHRLVAGGLTGLLLSLLTVASALADGTGGPYPR
jgi:hypothetical protein